MQYYYESVQHKICGPVEEVEIRRLWTEGILRNESIITPLGGTGRSYHELFLPRRAQVIPPAITGRFRTADLFSQIDLFFGVGGFMVCLALLGTLIFKRGVLETASVYPWARLFYGVAIAPIYLLMGIGLRQRWPWWGRFLAVIYSVIEIKVQIFFVIWIVFVLSFSDSSPGFWMACLTATSLLWSLIVVCYATFQSCILSRPAIVEAFDSRVEKTD